MAVLSTPPSARQLVDDAQRAYARAEYLEAAKLLEAASRLDPSGRILFNLARAWEKANEVEKAIIVYESYLDRPDAELQAMKRARKALATLYRIKPSTPIAPPTPTPVEPKPEAEPPPALVSKPSTDRPTEASPPAAMVVKPTAPAPPMTHTLRTVGVVTLCAAGVALGTAVGLGLWAQGAAAQARASLDPVAKPLLVGASQSRASFTDITFGVAATLAVTGAVFLLVDWLTTR
jgi:tetratricopeptide (TPR) repeat protein